MEAHIAVLMVMILWETKQSNYFSITPPILINNENVQFLKLVAHFPSNTHLVIKIIKPCYDKQNTSLAFELHGVTQNE